MASDFLMICGEHCAQRRMIEWRRLVGLRYLTQQRQSRKGLLDLWPHPDFKDFWPELPGHKQPAARGVPGNASHRCIQRLCGKRRPARFQFRQIDRAFLAADAGEKGRVKVGADADLAVSRKLLILC